MPSSRILFTVDGLRHEIYNSTDDSIESKNSYFSKMRQHFLTRAEYLGYNYIDLHPLFKGHYQEYGDKFEFSDDGHWNKLGHKVVSDAIKKSSFWKEVSKNSRH